MPKFRITRFYDVRDTVSEDVEIEAEDLRQAAEKVRGGEGDIRHADAAPGDTIDGTTRIMHNGEYLDEEREKIIVKIGGDGMVSQVFVMFGCDDPKQVDAVVHDYRVDDDDRESGHVETDDDGFEYYRYEV